MTWIGQSPSLFFFRFMAVQLQGSTVLHDASMPQDVMAKPSIFSDNETILSIVTAVAVIIQIEHISISTYIHVYIYIYTNIYQSSLHLLASSRKHAVLKPVEQQPFSNKPPAVYLPAEQSRSRSWLTGGAKWLRPGRPPPHLPPMLADPSAPPSSYIYPFKYLLSKAPPWSLRWTQATLAAEASLLKPSRHLRSCK